MSSPGAPLLITHEHCLDGATCAVVGMAAGLEPAFVYPDRVQDYLDGIPSDRAVILADVSLPLPQYRKEQARIVAIVDHHQSALPLKDEPRVQLDLVHAGSMGLYRWLVKNGRLAPDPRWEPLLAAVEDYDLWRADHKAGERLNRLLHDRGFAWFSEKFRDGFQPLTPEEEERLQVLEEEEAVFIARQLEHREDFTAGRHRCAVVVVDGEGAINEVAHRLLQAGSDAVFLIKPDGRISCRTTPAVDAARLMEEGFAGGGHPRAAGGRIPPEGGEIGPEAQAWLIGRAQSILAAHA
jgi:oligoribonuclease NrnB/cAMP/cGMP phosphodiesterase (DHH superfamily)